MQVVATVPLAAFVGGGELGTIITPGWRCSGTARSLAGGLLVAALCLLRRGRRSRWAQRALTPVPDAPARRRARSVAGPTAQTSPRARAPVIAPTA